MRNGSHGFWLCIAAAVAVSAIAVPAASGGVERSVVSRSARFEGTITVVNRETHTFDLKRRRNLVSYSPDGDYDRLRARIVPIKANGRTRYEHLRGLGALHKGLRVDVKVHRHGFIVWIADKIELSSSSNH